MRRRLRPFFPYYGSKYRAAARYPTPTHSIVCEPFAGSAGYSVLHHDRRVLLIDSNPVIVGVWDYLIHVSETELRALPNCQHVDDLGIVPQDARDLVGFWLKKSLTAPVLQRQGWSTQERYAAWFWCERTRDRIADQLGCIRHWRAICAQWSEIQGPPATWFIDPPYACAAGRLYAHHNVDYPALAEWCRTRSGQAIACEQEGATWLPFRALYSMDGTTHKRTTEVVWTNT